MAGNVVALSFIIISACCAVPLHHDCSIVSGGWDDEVKKLDKEDVQYCVIDNCTIKRLDTNQVLDIVDVSDDMMIAVSKDNHTTVAITLLPYEKYCQEDEVHLDHVHSIETTVLLALEAVLLVVVILLSAYVIGVYSIWDKLQSITGKIFVTYNVLLSLVKLFFLFLMFFHVAVTTITPVCQLIIYIDFYLILSKEVCTCVILSHIAYVLYQSCNQCWELSSEWGRNLLKFYTFITFTTMIPMIIFIALVDTLSGSAKHAILLDGHCILPPVTRYNIFIHLFGYSIPCKLVQLIAFILVVVYYKRLYNSSRGIGFANEPKVSLLFSLALVMIVSILLSNILRLVIVITKLSYTAGLYLDLIASVVEMMRQVVIAVRLTMLLKLKDLSKHFNV